MFCSDTDGSEHLNLCIGSYRGELFRVSPGSGDGQVTSNLFAYPFRNDMERVKQWYKENTKFIRKDPAALTAFFEKNTLKSTNHTSTNGT